MRSSSARKLDVSKAFFSARICSERSSSMMASYRMFFKLFRSVAHLLCLSLAATCCVKIDLALDARFAQLAEGHEVCVLLISLTTFD